MAKPINTERDKLIFQLRSKKPPKSYREIGDIFNIDPRAAFDGYYREAVKKGLKKPKSARVDLSTD